jgi:hypothetical protein
LGIRRVLVAEWRSPQGNIFFSTVREYGRAYFTIRSTVPRKML